MINPKHSTAKTRKANERPEKQSNKNKNQLAQRYETLRKYEHQTVNTNRMPKPDNALSTCQHKRREKQNNSI